MQAIYSEGCLYSDGSFDDDIAVASRRDGAAEETYSSPQNVRLGHFIGNSDSLSLNESALFQLSDSVRALTQEKKSFGQWSGLLLDLLNAFNDDEEDGWYSVNLDSIRACRLDKLLSDILIPESESLFPEHHSAAEHLQRQWRSRFKQAYFDMDKTRYVEFGKRGQLRDVTFRKLELFGQGCWQSTNCESLSEVEGNLHFEVGDDGIVASAFETPTKGRYGIAALPLMTGREEIQSNSNRVKYTRESKLEDAPVSLITQVGSKIRILRGHHLKSPLAPKCGIRYDGLYFICQYGHKLNQHSGLQRVVVTLERVGDQKALEQLANIPRPSQVDDWILFERYEGEMVKKRQGKEAFTQWKVAKAKEKIDRDQWKQVLRMTAELKLKSKDDI